MSKDLVIKQLTRECDALAASYWRLEASGRGQAYLEWLQKVKQTADIIEKNQPKSCNFFVDRLESANTNVSSRFAKKKVAKSSEK